MSHQPDFTSNVANSGRRREDDVMRHHTRTSTIVNQYRVLAHNEQWDMESNSVITHRSAITMTMAISHWPTWNFPRADQRERSPD